MPETLFYIVLEYHNFTLIMQMKNPKSIGYISPAINARIF